MAIFKTNATCPECGLLTRLRKHIEVTKCPACRAALTMCPVCGEPLTRCKQSLELVCAECTQAEAERLHGEATAEAAALAYRMDRDELPKYQEPSQFDHEPPF